MKALYFIKLAYKPHTYTSTFNLHSVLTTFSRIKAEKVKSPSVAVFVLPSDSTNLWKSIASPVHCRFKCVNKDDEFTSIGLVFVQSSLMHIRCDMNLLLA